jgi:hypothetical protein
MIKLKIILQKNYQFQEIFVQSNFVGKLFRSKQKCHKYRIPRCYVQLCPKTTIISFYFNEKEKKNFKILSKFKELSELTIYVPSYFESAKKT